MNRLGQNVGEHWGKVDRKPALRAPHLGEFFAAHISMNTPKFYKLPELHYSYDALIPFISEETLRLHHLKHHAAYVNGANAILKTMDAHTHRLTPIDCKEIFKELSFHVAGHLLHSLFWENLAPIKKGGGGGPSGILEKALIEEYGSFDRFKEIFTQTALATEGSGWAALTYCMGTHRPMIMQVEKHNLNVYPMFRILMVLDVWEHAYYIDYKNARNQYIDDFWGVVDWNQVSTRLTDLLQSASSPKK